MRRTRSLQDITPDRLPAAGSPSRIHHDNTRLTQSLNPQKPFFPHRRTVYVHVHSIRIRFIPLRPQLFIGLYSTAKALWGNLHNWLSESTLVLLMLLWCSMYVYRTLNAQNAWVKCVDCEKRSSQLASLVKQAVHRFCNIIAEAGLQNINQTSSHSTITSMTRERGKGRHRLTSGNKW